MVSCLLVVCLFQPCYQVLGAKTINQLQQEKNQYQQNKKEKTSSSKIKNPQNYYLGPLKDKDENIIFNSSYGSVEHDYSRVSRFILEHYEKEDLI